MLNLGGMRWLAGLTAAGLFLVGCGDDGIKSSTTARLAADPSAFVFPKLGLGQNVDRTVTIRNEGEGDLVIKKIKPDYQLDKEFRLGYRKADDATIYDGIGAEGEDHFAEQGLYPLVVPGGGSLDLVLNYKPADEIADGGKLVLDTNVDDNFEIAIRIANVGAEINVSPTTLDFGRVPAGESKTLEVTVTNLGQVELDVTGILVNGSQEFQPRIDGKDPRRVPEVLQNPDKEGAQGLGAGKSFTIEVTYSPAVEGPDRAEMQIASSDPNRPGIKVNLTANGATPCLKVVPAAVEFPSSLVNRVDSRQFTIESCGGEALEIYGIDAIDGPDGGDAFKVDEESLPSFPAVLPAAEAGQAPPSRAIGVTFEPREQRIYNGAIGIISNDPTGEPMVEGETTRYLRRVSLLGRGVLNACPQARPVQDEFNVQPLDVIALDGGASIDQDGPMNKPVEYEWVVLSSPEGSLSVPGEALLNPGDPALGVRDDDKSTPTAVFWADLVGTYTLELRVRDNLGLGPDQCETAVATVTIVAKPEQAIHVQLVWRTPNDPDVTDTEGTDLDLHLLHPNAEGWFTAPYDCYYYNPTPDWGQLDNPDDDPSIDIDDINGNGPENISLTNPENTTTLGAPYIVGVHYYRSADRRTGFDFGPSFAKVRIFINSNLSWDFSADGDPGEKQMEAEDHFWDVADIQWPSGEVRKRDRYYQQRP